MVALALRAEPESEFLWCDGCDVVRLLNMWIEVGEVGVMGTGRLCLCGRLSI